MKNKESLFFNLTQASIIHNRVDIYDYALELVNLANPQIDIEYNHDKIHFGSFFKLSYLYRAILKEDSNAVKKLLLHSGKYLNLIDGSSKKIIYKTFYYPELINLLYRSFEENKNAKIKIIEIILEHFHIEPNDFPVRELFQNRLFTFIPESPAYFYNFKEIFNRFKILYLFLKKGAQLDFHSLTQILSFILFFILAVIPIAHVILIFHLIVDVLIFNLTGKDLFPKDNILRKLFGYLFRAEPEI